MEVCIDIHVSLSDRYTARTGKVLITGVQALVRLMLLQADRDRAAGLRTSGFVSGYRGSPLGTLDLAFRGAGALPEQAGIVVRPAVNEELAATAIAGSQQLERSPGARVKGVFSLWYGKGPGLDRAADAIRHGNYQGSSAYGGVVVAVGDDHLAKSSSVSCYSDQTIASLQVPLLYPSDPQDIVLFGLHAFAASRLTGSWMALKIITEVADSTRSVPADEMRLEIGTPQIQAPPGGWHNRWPDSAMEQERRQQDYRIPAVQAYVRANRLDRVVGKQDGARIGIAAAGKSWLDVGEALRLLELDGTRREQLGVVLFKPALIWPIEPEAVFAFARGLETVLVVEEKGPFIEDQIKSILFGQERVPRVFGKTRFDGSALFPKTGDLTPEQIAVGLGELIFSLTSDEALGRRLLKIRAAIQVQTKYSVPPVIRKPFFCSGCPHNRSTVLPEGSRATAGIGCHGLAAMNRPNTDTFTQMGGEGIQWMGIAPFTDEKHIFANIGDGTYFHSGLLAIRQAVAANLNITYKLLYNNAVAMTGGQAVDGELSVRRVVDQLRAEGVKTIVLSTDEPDLYSAEDPIRLLVERIEHRDGLDALQKELRERPGVSVIVYEQMCAAEKRRMRKRGRMEDPQRRLFINELVCEGCGDCSAKSNCLSIEPIETEFGSKRRINQSSCNKDYSCLTGFCPSFVSIEGGRLRKANAVARAESAATLPKPSALVTKHQRILVAGIGGTGVVTIGALLSMAGHMEGRSVAVLDQVGAAQKGGSVTSHIHVADDEILALRIPPGQTDLLLACDEIVGNTRDVISSIDAVRTRVIANAEVSITGDFTQNPNAIADASLLARRLSAATGESNFLAFPFTTLAERLLGDAIASNLMMLGAAYQKGWLQLELEAFKAAVELNGVSVQMNWAAFEWGRRLVAETESVYKTANLIEAEPRTLDQTIASRAAFLVDYQDQRYAQRYRDRVSRVRSAEGRISPRTELTEAVAKSLFKLMAYKDEYEVARLYSGVEFKRSLSQQFEGDVKIKFHLAPPIISKRDQKTGEMRKRQFGGWMRGAFRLLAGAKGLRGTKLDPFGYTAERRGERALISEFEIVTERLVERLSVENLSAAVAIASLPLNVRGYGHVKERAVAAYRKRLAEALEDWTSSAIQVPRVQALRSREPELSLGPR